MKNKILNIVEIASIVVIILCIAYSSITIAKSDVFEANVIKKGLAIKSFGNVTYSEGNAYASLETYDLIIKKDLWCIATESENSPQSDANWQQIIDNKCNVKINNNDKYIYLKDNENNVARYMISDYISSVAKIETKDIKLIKGESKKADIKLKTVGNPDTSVTLISENEDIAKIEDGKIVAVNDGTTNIIVSDRYGNTEKIPVQVTSLITLPQINNAKPFIRYKQYTTEQAHILDDYLFYQIDEAGYETRAGVVAAARFLTLEFKYRIPYFLENGRITHFNHQRPYADGEGRYYHRGLYLSTDKYADLEKISGGPMMWGGYITEYSTDNGKMPNGLDCSGFVCWCLKNGGFDLGDIGGGLSEGLPTLSDFGVSQKITMELLEAHTVKAGDLIGLDGHIGIIIGIDDEHVYVADTLVYSKGTWVTKYTYKELVNSNWTNIYDYTNEYKAEGNYTNMW